MLTARLCDALSSFARPGSSAWSCSAVPRLAWSANSYLFRWEKTTVVAVKIKLKRLGKIREPYYRIVVADARTKRDGRAIEEIGKYHPKAEPSFIEVNSERVQHWLSVGAQPTDPVRVLLKITGDWQKFTGEPGAEGTLRTAKPREDKKERFEAAAKESQANKEAREERGSKSGTQSRTAKPAKDTSAKDTSVKEAKSPAPAKAPSADAKPADAKAADVKPADAKAADVKPADAKAADATPADAKAADATPADAEAATPDADATSADASAADADASAADADATSADASAADATSADAVAADAEASAADAEAPAESGGGA
jgi:small subunit ribosomal protein S16